jgi:hypothetical protein
MMNAAIKLVGAIVMATTASLAFAQHGAEARNVALVGFNDLQARSA